MKKHVGILAVISSAIIFGVVPILVSLSYQGGSNAITSSFLRSFLALPILYIITKQKRISLKITKKELGQIILFGFIGVTLTGLALTSSYQYIPAGITTTLHFTYPVLVTVAGFIFFRDKIRGGQALALLLSFAGVLFFMGNSSDLNILGILLALLSGVTYTFYMLGIERTELKDMHYFKLSFYFCLVTSVSLGIMGLVTRELQFNLTPVAWSYSFLVAILASVGALSLFQIGIKSVGASTAAILSTLEPITSIVLGVLFLNETVTPQKLFSSILILSGVILMTYMQSKSSKSNASSPTTVPLQPASVEEIIR